ncbi:MAG: ornithine carbamoyltransferase [Promethearchaeota archaeon]|nr:MAG: ornithine carbamoyltransferase [Candidatus Lokiarchaeota archaeon]
MPIRHLTKVSDFTREECEEIIDYSIHMKADKWNPKYTSKLQHRTLLMLFAKPSLRTRVSFETGMTQLGGHAIFYSIKDSPLGVKETIEDTTKCASRYVDIISARVFKRAEIWKMAENADVPVINMLDDFAHPCQILCDFQTIKEEKGSFDGLKLSFYGDCENNVTYDLMRMAAMFGMNMDVVCPSDPIYAPVQEVIDECAEISQKTGAVIRVVHDVMEGAKDADILYADSWMSYGVPKEEEEKRVKDLMPYQINMDVLKAAKSDTIFMNCLPAKRGYEESAEVIDGPQSIVFDQAENRLHVQKAIILFLLGLMD